MEMKGRDGSIVYQCRAFSLSVNNSDKTTSFRKPPTAPKSPSSLSTICIKHPTARNSSKTSSGPRKRSASTGRDKKSELQARYWALLFGNLQRAVNEIYQTVECYENISSCQEAILVLENYVRDFKALSEWFKVSWDYETTPLPQRPLSLAWEVRKSNPVPRARAKSLSSPTVSGKSSPCFSGKCSPCCLEERNMLSPRKGFRPCESITKSSMRVNIRELFSSSKRNPTDNSQKEEIISNIDPSEQVVTDENWIDQGVEDLENELTTGQEQCMEKCDQYAQTDLEDENLTLAEVREKLRKQEEIAQEQAERLKIEKEQKDQVKSEVKLENAINTSVGESITPESDSSLVVCRDPSALELTLQKLNAMEDSVIVSDSLKAPPLQIAEVKKVEQILVLKNASSSETKKLSNIVTNGPLKYSSVLNNKPVAGRTVVIAAKLNTSRATRPAPSVSSVQRSSGVAATGQNNRQSGGIVASKIVPAPIQRNFRNSQPPATTRPSSKLELHNRNNAVSRLSTRSRTMIEMNTKTNIRPTQSIKGSSEISKRDATVSLSSYSRKSSYEEVGSSSSTLKASNERIVSSRTNVTDDRHSEPKQMPNESSNDGWLTVKNRRRSSLHWANRFNQPTGYASLPTLALLTEKQEEIHNKQKVLVSEHSTKSLKAKHEKPSKTEEKSGKNVLLNNSSLSASRPEIRNAKAKVNSLPQRKILPTSHLTTQNDATTPATLTQKQLQPLVTRQAIIKRQKSDLTGLKLTSLHKEYMRSERFQKSTKPLLPGRKDYTVDAIDIVIPVANVEEIVNDPSAPSVEQDVDQNKIHIKIQTNRDFSKTIGDLYESLSASASATNDNQPGALSSCDESEEQTDVDCDEDQRKLLEEEQSLERQIRELENTEIDVDTETDETDGEAVIDHENRNLEHIGDVLSSKNPPLIFVDDENISLEMRYQALLSEMSWGEREEALATLQAYVSRHPGRAQELHQKLSSPSRRRSLQETLKKYQAKQARAQQKRENLKKERATKIQNLLARVEDVKAAKQHLIEEKRLKMEGRLQRAAENRTQFLRQIIEKAHDEDKKLKEINFIKNIEAQNKRLDLIESSKETEGRLQDLEQERQKRLEEKAAKEAAVERRRQELEQARQRKLEKMNESRLEREQRIGKMQEQKEKLRQALAREKARDREERLLALQVQQQQTTEELQRKILQKQKESARRHEENMEHIRQRALELSIPSRTVDENGQRVEIGDLNGDGDLSSTVSDVGSREHTRGYKKKMKKLKQRMSQEAEEYLKELQPVPHHIKRESQVPKFLNLVGKGGGAQGLERQLGQLVRLMAKAQVFDFQCFLLMDGLGIITTVITKGMEPNSDISKKAVVLAVQMYRNACTLCPQIARHAILGNSVAALFDALFQSLQLPEEKSPQHPVELSTELMLACTVAIHDSRKSYNKKHTHPKTLERLPDLISYAVTLGLIEILSRRCMKIRESIENHQSVVLSLLATLGFLTRFVDICPPGPADATRFLNSAKSTELFGSISMLYSSVVPVGECVPPRTISLAAATFNLLVSMAVLDLATFQEVISGESLSLKFLDVVTVLLKYCGGKCSPTKSSEAQAVIIDLIATIGFFCANNRKNQDLLTSEQSSIIIKSLTKLPEHLNVVIYPCLVTIIYQNEEARNVISRDFNLEFLDEYSKSEKAKKNHLIAVLKEKT